jgi:phosphopantetheinyl transferase (holo-ACP synthase)
MRPFEVIVEVSASHGEQLWNIAARNRARQALFAPGEVAELGGRGSRIPTAAARLCGKVAVRRALLRAAMPEARIPRLQDIRLRSDRFGRPEVDLPEPAARWLVSAGLGLDLSLSHTGGRVFAVVVAAP